MRHFAMSHGIDIPDAIMAATAEHRGLRLATLNVKHFPMSPKLKRRIEPPSRLGHRVRGERAT
jgi:predicted nucleic acid-binding protein